LNTAAVGGKMQKLRSLARHLDKLRGLLKIIWAAVFAKFSLDVWADIDDSG
jgi:hypothetical protein